MQHQLSINPEGMTAPQLLMAEILLSVVTQAGSDGVELAPIDAVADNVEEQLDDVGVVLGDECYEAHHELRSAGTPSNLSTNGRPFVSNYSRHFDCKEVAYQTKTGHWVGWTYWSGGGKHGEPECIDWLEHAYLLEVVSEKQVTEYEFKAKGEH